MAFCLKMHRRWIQLVMSLLILTLSPMCPALYAQVDQGTISGLIQDSSGAVIAGATVTLTNTDTGFALKRSTGQGGAYTFSPIKIGDYQLLVSAPGFASLKQEKLHVNVQQHLSLT